MVRLLKTLNSPRITLSLVAGMVILLAIVLWSWLGPLLVDVSQAAVGSAPPALPPEEGLPFGTDSQGRSVLSVMVIATPQTLKMGLIAGMVGIGIGLLLGLFSGFFGGPIDATIRVMADSIMTVPAIAILIIIASNVESMSVEVMALTVASLAWMHPTRTIRSQVLSIRERAYTSVARANGQSELEVLFREIMPNLMPYVAASLVVAINGAILATVGLESLGLGAENVHTLGTTIYWARRYSAVLRGQWWWWGPPIAIISLIFIGLFLLSIGLDRFANPTLSSRPKVGLRSRRGEDEETSGDDVDGDVDGAAVVESGEAAVSALRPVAAPADALLRIEDLRVVFDTPSGSGPAVDGVSLNLKPGERMGLVGESGCGKTTMATALLSMIRPPGRVEEGRVLLGGRDLLSLSDNELRKMRLNEVALIPQAAMNSLNPVMRIRDQITDAIVAHDPTITEAKQNEMVQQSLEQVGLEASVANRFPHELSGGMKQRATMAIATVMHPSLIIADEPTSALDVVVQRQVMRTLGRVQKELGAATVLIGHDMGLIAQFSDSIGVLYAGQLVERGEIDEVLASPFHPYTKLLIDSLPGLEAKKELVGIPGLPPALFDRPNGCRFHPRCPLAFDRCRHEIPLPQQVDERQVACHLYPSHSELPPMPVGVVAAGPDGANGAGADGDGIHAGADGPAGSAQSMETQQ